MGLSNELRIELVKRNTEEILTENDLKDLIEKKQNPKSYYGTAPSGPFHLGYLIPLSKLFEFNKAGIKNKVLLANIHASLDDLKAPWEKNVDIAKYYQKCIELSFPWTEVPEFVLGSSFQLTEDYQSDVLKLASLTSVTRANRAASEVTRMKNPKVSELIYPIMQALDEEYLKVDIQLGGIDQRHIFAYAREYLPMLGYLKRVEIMTPLIVSLKGPGVKMSSSIPETSIKPYESEDSIAKKISNSYCPIGVEKDNPILQLMKFIVFPIRKKVRIERQRKYGGDLELENYEILEDEFKKKLIHPSDVKNTLSSELTRIFEKVRKYYDHKLETLENLGKNFK